MPVPKWLMPNARQVLAGMVFWGQIQNYMMRASLSILIVAMVKDPPIKNVNNSSIELHQPLERCPREDLAVEFSNSSQTTSQQSQTDGALFEWDSLTRGVVLSALSYGYICTQVIGGRMAEVYGVKRVYGLCQLGTALLCFLSPAAAKLHVVAFIILRAMQGAFQGVTFPALQAMVGHWIPVEERSSFIARSFFGTTFGLIFTFPMCGALVVAAGWESAFYVIGALTLVWFIFWWILVFDNPEKHPRISRSEKDLIQASISNAVEEQKKMPVPWKSIFTSIPYLGLMLTDAGNSWGIIALASHGPTYLKYMLGVDIKTNGLLSGLPMLTRYLGGVFHSLISDWLIRRKFVRVVNSRRTFNSISQVMPAIAMLMLAFAPPIYKCDVTYAIVLLCVGMFFNGAISSGHFSSYTDLTPNFAGTLMGISNTVGSFLGIIVPTIIGAITQDNMTFSAWQTIFSMAVAAYVCGNVAYVVAIKGEPQKWNYADTPKDEEEIEKRSLNQN